MMLCDQHYLSAELSTPVASLIFFTFENLNVKVKHGTVRYNIPPRVFNERNWTLRGFPNLDPMRLCSFSSSRYRHYFFCPDGFFCNGSTYNSNMTTAWLPGGPTLGFISGVLWYSVSERFSPGVPVKFFDWWWALQDSSQWIKNAWIFHKACFKNEPNEKSVRESVDIP
jgi:hypothetical protein